VALILLQFPDIIMLLYDVALNMKNCPFCHISNPILYDSELVISFYDGYPTSPGHALVVPKRHMEIHFECTPVYGMGSHLYLLQLGFIKSPPDLLLS